MRDRDMTFNTATTWGWPAKTLHWGSAAIILLLLGPGGGSGGATFRVPRAKDVFGIDIPPIVTTVDRPVRQWIEESHMVLAYLLAAVVLIHIFGALRHHILKRNDVLRRMTWGMQV